MIFKFNLYLKCRFGSKQNHSAVPFQGTLVSLGITLLFSSLPGCTSERSEIKLPSKEKYVEDTNLMMNICTKFYMETDAARLHKVAVATQSTRVVSCENYFGECDQYGKFLDLVIDSAKDNVISQTERTEMKLALDRLKAAVMDGRKKLP